jgi:galactokinase
MVTSRVLNFISLFVRSIENKYLGLENGILDPSAILLSRYGYLTFMDCKVVLSLVFSESLLF